MSGETKSPGLDVECPFCRGRLTVDAETGQLLESRRPQVPTRDFDSLLDNVLTAEQRNEEKFKRAYRDQQLRRDTLQKKFERARKKAEEESSGPKDHTGRD